MVVADGIAPMAGFDVIGDVPEKFARAAHIIRLNFRFLSPCENDKAAADGPSSGVSFDVRRWKSFPQEVNILHIFSM